MNTFISNKKVNPSNFRAIIGWMFFFSTLLSYAQKNNYFDSKVDQELSSSERIKQIDSIIRHKEKTKNDSLPFLYHDFAYVLYKSGKKTKAIISEKKAFNYARTKTKLDKHFIQRSGVHLGFYYRKNNQFTESIKAYNESLNYKVDSLNTYKALKGMAFCYKNFRDFHQAITYFKLAYNIIQNDKTRLGFLRDLAFSIGNSYQFLNTKSSLEEGIKYCKIADSLSNLTNTSNRKLYSIKLQIATLYNKHSTLDIDRAQDYYKEALAIAINEGDVSKISEVYRFMGNLYNTSNKERSLRFLNKSSQYISELDSLAKYNLNYDYFLTYSFNKEYDKSLAYGNKSLQYLLGISFTELEKLDKNIIVKTDRKKYLLYILPNLAETYLNYYEETNKLQLLKKSIAYFKLADFVIDLLKINSSEFKSKLFWRELSTDIYGKAIKACYLDDNIDAAFYFMEKNKALLLMEDIATKNYKQSLEVAPHLLAKENELKRNLLLLDNALKKDNLPDKTSDSNNKVKIDLNRNLHRFQDSIYPDKHTLEEPEIRALSVTKQQIENDEVLVEYHISIDDGYGIYSNNENAYVLFITNKSEYFFEIPNQSILKKEVTQLNNLLKKPFTSESDIITYQKVSHEVYKSLFPTAEIRELIKNKKLRIIADSYLSVLPFESLITTENTSNYLIEDSNISYLYSYSFLRNNTYASNKKTSFLGFAPVSFDYDNLAALAHTKTEIEYLNNYYKGESFLEIEASKDNFLSELSKHNLIHLATHADAQDSISPWIAFSDKKISLEELYLTNSNASLVVLSGCNTTLGKQEVGEGVMSLARGFFYSGTQSVVSSLWSIDDTSTSYIMNEFYKNLQNGLSKSESLRNAKLTYLNSHSLSDASPYYWASLILLGEDDILLDTTTHWGIYVGIFFIICLIVFFFFRKKRSTD